MSEQNETIDVEYMSPPEPTADTAGSEASAEIPPSGDPESTIGTGTSMALGCVAGTVLLIGFALLFLLLSNLR